VLWYLLQGGRHIDDADVYWNHQAVGGAMREAEALGVPRSEVFLTTKLFPSFFGSQSVNATVHRFLAELGVDYIDLVLMHAPSHPLGRFGECKGKTWKVCRQETWQALTVLRDSGKIRDIGVSNFNVRHMDEILSLGSAPIAANQIAFHPWAEKWQRDAVQYCHNHGIAVTAYNSLGGFLEKALPETVETLKGIADVKGKTVSLVLLRWALQKNVSVIPGTSNPRHMRENLGVYGFELTGDEIVRLDALHSDPNGIKIFGMPEDET
jgi:diketogulonate reductase-like aldo/keto reductase